VQQLLGVHSKHESCCIICPCNLQVLVQVYDCCQGITAMQGNLQKHTKLHC